MKDRNDKLLEEIGDLLTTYYTDLETPVQTGPEIALGRYLRALRECQYLTRAALSDQSGVPESEILAYEHGLIAKRRMKVETLTALAQALEEELDNFLLLLEVRPIAQSAAKLKVELATEPLHRFKAISPSLVKPYRLLAPLVTLIIFFCLQIGSASLNPVWQNEKNYSLVRSNETAKALTNQSYSAKSASSNVAPSVLWQGVQTTVNNQLLAVQMPIPSPAPVPDPVLSSMTSVLEARIELAPQILPSTNISSPVVHIVSVGETLWCIASKYYDNGDFYPLLCQYNFGEPLCSQPLHPGDLLAIPTFEDFEQSDQPLKQSLLPLPAGLIDRFKALSQDEINTNQTNQLRGIDYFCQEDDYENYGEKLVLAGQVRNPATRIPGWPRTKG